MIARLPGLVVAALLAATPSAAQEIDAERLMSDLGALAADEMQGRATGSPGGRRARAYIVRRFEASGLSPAGAEGWLQPFTARSRRGGAKAAPAANVVGRLDGTAINDRCLVVTAHYDHEGVRDSEIYNGADDNASGVAALFELARLFRQAPLRHCVLFVALDAEERGLLGAEAFLSDPPVPADSLAVNVNLDMIARGDNGVLWVVGTHQNPGLRPLVEALAPPPGVTLRMGRDRPEDRGRENWVALSDQAAFHRAGIPFLFFSVDDHPDYHRPSDDAERIDAGWYAGAVAVVRDALRALDAYPDPAAAARGDGPDAIR